MRTVWRPLGQCQMLQCSHHSVVSEEETEKGPEKIVEERIVGNFLNLEKLKSAKYRKFRVPPRMNPKENTPRHIVIRMRKIKERILKAAREKQQKDTKELL